ncbi:MAG: hypothetical protein KIS78_11910 [Labilithrix sp.]|nr:hypothetical protein [Labilithrix sp.]
MPYASSRWPKARWFQWSVVISGFYLAGCAGRNERAHVPVAVVVGGSPESRAAVAEGLKSHPVARATLRLVAPAPVGSLGVASAGDPTNIGLVRKKYMAADVDGCLAALGDDARLVSLLGAQDRDNAARYLFWRVACRVAGDQITAAESDASTFAVLGLRMPPDARDASPDVENLIDRAIQRVANTESAEVEVTANAPRASIRIDGREDSCIAPCVIKAPLGTHLLGATADGALPAMRRVAFDAPRKKIEVTMPSAPPDVAATQWRTRYESMSEEQSIESARLLSVAVPARYLVLLSPERSKIRGLLYFDREVRGRAEVVGHDATSPKAPSKLVDELLHQGKLVESKPLWSSPIFWLATIGTAAIASTVTYVVLRDPPERTVVRVE